MAIWIAIVIGALMLLAVYFVVITRLAPKTRTRQRMRDIQISTASTEEERMRAMDMENVPFSERVIVPLFHYLERKLSRFAPKGIREMLELNILRAGKGGIWNVNAFATLWILSIVIFGAWMTSMNMDSPDPLPKRVLLSFMGFFLGGCLPFVFLRTKAQKRQEEIMRQLPELLDLLSVSVQAGLSFDSALANVVERMKGPLCDECNRMLKDIRMGMTKKAAMKAMAHRCDVQDVSLFITSIIQAEQLGASMSTTLVTQASNIRERRRQYVKAQALKAPVKILIPLIMFIFPALMVVILLPIGLSLLNIFSNM